ncbi:MAG: penicillin-binding protein 2 [Pseudomonadota bacterium]
MLNIPIKDYFRETRLFHSRLAVAAVLAGLLILLLLARLVYLQLIAHRHYETLAQANRIRPIPIPPARGLILDRHGVVLAQNYPVYTLEIVPEQVVDMNVLLEELGRLVRLTEGELKQFNKLLRERPRFETLILRTHLTEEEAARVALRRPYLNGVELQARLQRHYPLGGVAVHALGYVARIDENDQEKIDRNAYRGTQHIGKLGLEASYETPLLGRVGFERNETNAHGRVLRTLDRQPPVAGRNLTLHLDVKLQQRITELLGKRRGAVVAMDPQTGAVLALVSTPTFDPNPFVNGIDTASYTKLRENPDNPLYNRALNGVYSPGSTIKVFLGLLALEDERFQPDRPVHCAGRFNLPGDRHVFRDWKPAGHGAVILHDAIVQSCDVYFYRLAHTLGIQAMKDFLASFGFGRRTGVDLPGESSGILPSPEWKQARGLPWYPGETVMTGIGQGPILVTPLQLSSAVSMLANGGRRLKPRLAMKIEDAHGRPLRTIEPARDGALSLRDPAHLATLVKHMTAVVHSNKGTGFGIGWNAPYNIAGKTGTAQVKGIAQGAFYNEKLTPERFRDHALFIAFAPAENPRVAVAVIVENAGHGGAVAAPIARQVMDYVIMGEHGCKDPAWTEVCTKALRAGAAQLPKRTEPAGD